MKFRNIENILEARTELPVFISRREVENLLNISRSTIYAKMDVNSNHYDPDFPTPIKFGMHERSKVSWVRNEILNYAELIIKRVRN